MAQEAELRSGGAAVSRNAPEACRGDATEHVAWWGLRLCGPFLAIASPLIDQLCVLFDFVPPPGLNGEVERQAGAHSPPLLPRRFRGAAVLSARDCFGDAYEAIRGQQRRVHVCFDRGALLVSELTAADVAQLSTEELTNRFINICGCGTHECAHAPRPVGPAGAAAAAAVAAAEP